MDYKYCGATDVIEKPFELNDVLGKIAKITTRQAEINAAYNVAF